MVLRLTDNERELLVELLQEQRRHLLLEIAKAYHFEFKIALRERCNVLEGVMEKLGPPVQAAV